ncbi:MAG: DUF2100 domain-containing protein [Promethearchaeota archaeon]
MKKLNSEEVKAVLAAIDDLIDIKLLIRKIVPNYHLNEEIYESFISKLESLRHKLTPLFLKYLSNDDIIEKETSEDIKSEILNLAKKEMMILISANSSKKKLKNMGVDPRILIASGGPLAIEDYKIINPNLSENALKNIEKKCNRLINQLRNEDWSKNNLIFIYEKENPTDLLILNKLDKISSIIGKKVKIIGLDSWKILDD